MAIYFAFSDECGDYLPVRSKKFNIANPFYIRSAMLLNAEDWKKIQKDFIDLKKEFEIPLNKEVKWSYLWSLRAHEKNRKPISPDKDYYFLRDYNTRRLLEFVIKTINLLEEIDIKIIVTITDNLNEDTFVRENKMLKWHLQNIMQRIEMEIQNLRENLCIFFLDPVSEKKDRLLREVYHQLYLSGDFISKYSHIKDSLNIECSHHSVGIQIADYISGVINGFLRGFDNSKWIFQKHILNKLRKNCEGKIVGYGIICIPSNDENFKKFLIEKIKN